MKHLALSDISGPTDNSVEDFWRMIWEQRVPTIVMLTRIFEGRVSDVLRGSSLIFPCGTCDHYIPQVLLEFVALQSVLGGQLIGERVV